MVAAAHPKSVAAVSGAAAPVAAGLRVLGGVPRGRGRLPGDKSLSHRALLFAALAEGPSHLRGLLGGGDAASTARVLRSLGVAIEGDDSVDGLASAITVHGVGFDGLLEPPQPLDCGRSGTTMRLLAGVLAGRPGVAICTGDPQLLRRPMRRVLAPLQAMGALVMARGGGDLAPFAIRGGSLRGIDLTLTVASAQVKGALLLAGLQAQGASHISEPSLSRDHTERMLAALGAPVRGVHGGVRCEPLRQAWRGFDFTLPGDPSSAAFLLGAAAITPGADVEVHGMLANPTRAAFLDVLRRAGAQVEMTARGVTLGEPTADVRVRPPVDGARLRPVVIAGAEIPAVIDELPLLAVVLCHAEGPSLIADAAELRVKESDRIRSVVLGLRAIGAGVEELADGMRIAGGGLRRAAAGAGPRRVETHGDHRLAMAFAIAGLPTGAEIEIDDIACTADSFPGFVEALRAIGVASTPAPTSAPGASA